ncbi:MAG: hypothetical protein JWO78_1059, partial [Micavibrio sp.]|nr:hypothetical protein [Micavibrio sp.]
DKFLTYTMRLPSSWTKADLGSGDTGKNILGDIAHYDGPATLEARSRLIIQATELGYDITARNWMLNYILSRGYTLQGMRVVSDKRIEAMFIYLDHDISYVVRSVAEINGSRMILLLYYVPEIHWNEEKGYQTLATKSFKFLAPEKARVETVRNYAFLDLLRFDYPSSWRLQAPNILSTETMSAKIINSNDNNILNGQIDVNIISTELDTTLPEEIKKVQKAMDTRGLVIGKLIEQPKDYKPQSQVYYSRIEMYQANDKNKELVDYEYWIGVLIENRYYYIVTMLTPSRSSDFFVWARNSEAFRTVIESLRP